MGASDLSHGVFVKKDFVDIFGVDEPTEEHHIRILCRKNSKTRKWICNNISDEFFYLIASIYTKTCVRYVSE